MEKCLKEVITILNKPLFQNIIIPSNHLIFIKYSNQKYFKYAFELLDSLVKKCEFEDKHKLFHTSLYYLLKILYNSGNKAYYNNFDLIILSCFFLGIKTIGQQKKMINLIKLKNIYSEKFSNYDNEKIKNCEIICIYLLKYDINFLTIYDCLSFLLKNDKEQNLKNKIIEEFESKMLKEGIKSYIYKKPMDMAKEIISSVIIKFNRNKMLFIKKKEINKIVSSNYINNNKQTNYNRNEESLSTSESLGSLQKSNSKKNENTTFYNEYIKNIEKNHNKNSHLINNNQSFIKISINSGNNYFYSNSNILNNNNNDYLLNQSNTNFNNYICISKSIKTLNYKQNRLDNIKKNDLGHKKTLSDINNNKYNITFSKNNDLEKTEYKNIFRKPLITYKTSKSKIINIKKAINNKSKGLFQSFQLYNNNKNLCNNYSNNNFHLKGTISNNITKKYK